MIIDISSGRMQIGELSQAKGVRFVAPESLRESLVMETKKIKGGRRR
jgi:hypothetical protein